MSRHRSHIPQKPPSAGFCPSCGGFAALDETGKTKPHVRPGGTPCAAVGKPPAAATIKASDNRTPRR